MGFFKKISDGLKKTRDSIKQNIESVINSFTKIDEELFEELEEILIMSDVGAVTASRICDELRQRVKQKGLTDASAVKGEIRDIVSEMLQGDSQIHFDAKPKVILVIGVNGAGKTTTIGKMASNFVKDGKKVVIAAADTFRAAAIDQVAVWAERAGAELVRHSEGSDPAAVVFDAIAAGKSRGADVVICDTAGRLHNKKNLMDELNKISRVCAREVDEKTIEVLLVLDATTGQNALNQARQFKEAAGLTGIVLTKLDGTAKGGVIIGIKEELGIPVKYIGVGEKAEDLQPFDPDEFAKALFGDEDEEE